MLLINKKILMHFCNKRRIEAVINQQINLNYYEKNL